MKWNFEAVGRLIITLILMGFAIAFMFKFPEYYWGAIFFVTLIIIWDFMYYKDFKYLKFGKNGLEAKANSNGIHNQHSPVKRSKINFHKEFQNFETPGLDIMLIGQYRTPSGIEEFSKLVRKAKESHYPLKEDNAYLESARTFQNHIVEQLFASMENYDSKHIMTEEYKNILRDVLYESDYDKDQFVIIRIDLIEQLGHKEAINHRFERAINDLDKISADSKLA